MDFGCFTLVENVHEDRLEPPFLNVCVAQVEPKHGSTYHKQMSGHWNKHHELKFLKKIRKTKENGLHFLEILLCSSEDFPDFEAVPELANLLSTTNPDLKTIPVPSEPPFNQVEKQIWEKIWPISFNPTERKLEFTEEEKSFFQECMRKAVKIAEDNKEKGHLPIGVVIVNSIQKKIVSFSADCRHKYPLDHAVFKAIKEKEDTEEDPYLLRGCDVFVTSEPCVMCAMALIHSKVNRVFYGVPTEEGALGSHILLHKIKNLNHKFDCFKGLCEEECQQLWGEN